MYQTDRISGLKRSCRKLGMTFSRDLLFIDAGGYSWRDYSFGAVLGRKVLELKGDSPTALVCLNDCLAIGAMRVLQEAGKAIPGDYSVVGFDNTPESQWGYPSLTSVDQNISSLMESGKALLWNTMKGLAARRKMVKPQLVIRGSTGPVARS